MKEKIRWGILGTGNIAHKFARGLKTLPDAELIAVGSRAQSTADAFADEFNVPRRHATYEGLANDREVDVIYVSTPHSLHLENTLLCLNANKPVLCEKPFAINAGEAKQMIDCARGRGRFLMEAMWTRFIPAICKVRELIAEGSIGEVRMLEADFGYSAMLDPKSRVFDPMLGGGALLDVGVYTISFASMILGKNPTRVASMAHLGECGVDEQSAMILGYDKGELAMLWCAVRTNTALDAAIIGTEGRIRVHPPFWVSTKISVSGKQDAVFEMPLEGNGFNYEAAEVMQCLREDKMESDIVPLDETLAIMKTMDEIRTQWGLKYPME